MSSTKTCHLVGGELPEVGKQIKVQIIAIGTMSGSMLPEKYKEPVLTGKILKVYKNGNFEVQARPYGVNKYKVVKPKITI